MIIKNKPFHIVSAQCVLCAFYFPAAVVGCSARPRGYSVFDYAALLRWVRRDPGFVKLEAYKVRLSSILADRCIDLKYYRATGDWAFSPEFQAHLRLMRSAGVL